jgi:uncharacterized protein YecT (DUF1311 family)
MNKIFIILLLFPLFSIGQETQIKQPWEIGCDKMMTQTKMNICSYQSYKIADSILTIKYNSLISYLDNRYKEAEINVESHTDTIQLDYLNLLRNQIQSVKASQKDFYKFLESTTDIIHFQFEGGSMRPLVVNKYSLDLTVKQIEIMNNLSDDIKK